LTASENDDLGFLYKASANLLSLLEFLVFNNYNVSYIFGEYGSILESTVFYFLSDSIYYILSISLLSSSDECNYNIY
jgi:hypothetical protein